MCFKKKTKLFLDVDDTVFMSSEVVVDILNKRYKKNEDVNDMWDYSYRSLFPETGEGEVDEIFSSKEFFENVKVNPDFEEWYKKNKRKYDITFVTKGTEENLKRKESYLSKLFDAKFVGIPYHVSKGIVDMKGGVYVDDICEYMCDSNAKLKIVLTNKRYTKYNKDVPSADNILVAFDWKEIGEILDYYENNHLLR